MGGLGFRRIEQVHVTVHDGHAVATVTGIAHRYPRTLRVPIATAARLVAAGVPVRVDQSR
jgi:hypothetical protein